MPSARTITLSRALTFLAVVVILKVTAAVVLGYRNYFPPNFQADFLRGRERYFFGAYQWAFYPHLAAGPASLLLGLILLSDRFRLRHPRAHRILGRVQGLCVLLVVAPSGLWMATRSAAGTIGGIGFGLLAVLTAACVALGWRAAVQRRYGEHRWWMQRCFLLLCSAVVIRVLGGFATVFEIHAEWWDPAASWASWLIPLAVFEGRRLAGRRPSRPRVTRTTALPVSRAGVER